MSAALTVLAVLFGLGVGIWAVASVDLLVRPGAPAAAAALRLPLARAWRTLRTGPVAPEGADGLLFWSAPVLTFASVCLGALIIPIAPGWVGFDLDTGLFYFLVILGPVVVGLMNAGWGSGTATGVLGMFRAATHLLSYEVAIGFAFLGPVMHARSLSAVSVVEAQSWLWYGVWQPVGLLLYLAAALIMTYRRPFDLPMAGSELSGGVLAQYGGPLLLLHRAALHGLFLLLMAMGVVLFLGGWRGPWLPAPAWFAVKTLALSAAVLAVSHRLPRVRHDQMLALSWKVLVPAGLLNVLWVGALSFVVPGGIR